MVYTFVDRAGEIHALELTKSRKAVLEGIVPSVIGEDLSSVTVTRRSTLCKAELNEGVKVHIVGFNAGQLILDCDNESPIMISFRGRVAGSEMDEKAYARAEKYVVEEFGMDAEETYLARKCIVWTNAAGKITDIIYALKTHSSKFNNQDGFYKLVNVEDVQRVKLPFSSSVAVDELLVIL